MFFRFILIASLAFWCGITQADPGTLNLKGSTTVTSNLISLYKNKLQEMTGLTLKVGAIGSGKGMRALVNGEADMAMISAELPAVLQKMGLEDDGMYQAHKVGETSVSFGVHPDNTVRQLSDAQVEGILLGDITNWKQVGGADKDIKIVTEYKGGGFRTMVEKDFLGKREINEEMTISQPNGLRVLRVAENVPTGFVVITTSMLKGSSLVPIETEKKVIQPLIFVTKGAPTEDMKKLIEASKDLLQGE